MTINELLGLSTEELCSKSVEELTVKLQPHFETVRRAFVPPTKGVRQSTAQRLDNSQAQLDQAAAMLEAIRKNLAQQQK